MVKLNKIIALAVCILFLPACAKKAESVPPTVDFVATTLGQAAEQAHGELAMIARLRGQGMKPLLPSPDPSLDKLITISWTGIADGVIKEICLQLGYRYREIGNPSVQGIAVVVNGLNRPAYDLLEDIAWQIQPQAVLRVDPVNRVITLAKTKGVESLS